MLVSQRFIPIHSLFLVLLALAFCATARTAFCQPSPSYWGNPTITRAGTIAAHLPDGSTQSAAWNTPYEQRLSQY